MTRTPLEGLEDPKPDDVGAWVLAVLEEAHRSPNRTQAGTRVADRRPERDGAPTR